MEFETIIYKKEGPIARIIMNRPEKRNAQNGRMIEEMDAAFVDAERDSAIRVVVLSGAGKTFCAGHDLKLYPVEEGAINRPPNIEGKWYYERDYFYDKLLRSWRLKKPVIAQVQGHALAAGFMIANMCDLVVASDDAQFGDPVVRMGAAAAEILCHPWVLPPRIAKEMLFTGNYITAQRAYELGMVNQVVPLEELENSVTQLAEHISKMPPFTVSIIKNSINRTMDMQGFENSLNAHFDTHVMSHWSDEAQTYFEQSRRESKSIKEFITNRDDKFVSKEG
ncbi:enoyl-CoA hydratase [Ureibacillus composti]